MSIDPRWARARRILVSRLDNLGDVILATPAIHAIRESLPEARITLHASPSGAQVAALNPDVDDVVVYQAPWMDPDRLLPQTPEREQEMIVRLRAGRYDGAIIFTSYHESPLPTAYLYYLADIPLRHAASIDGPGSLLTSRHRHPERLVHEVERGLDLVGGLGFRTEARALVLTPRPDDLEAMRVRLASLGMRPGDPLVVLHPGSTTESRTYPGDQYATTIRLLVEELGCQVVITGTAGEVELVERIRAASGASSASLAGQTTFPELAALIALADLAITNNTGPMHVAAALKTPVVALFALTNPPEQWGPWRVPHRLLYHPTECALCYTRRCPVDHACLRKVTPEQVVGAAAELLSDGNDGRKPPRRDWRERYRLVSRRWAAGPIPRSEARPRAGADPGQPASGRWELAPPRSAARSSDGSLPAAPSANGSTDQERREGPR